MKKLLLFTTASITGLIIYLILTNKRNLNKNDNFQMKPRSVNIILLMYLQKLKNILQVKTQTVVI